MRAQLRHHRSADHLRGGALAAGFLLGATALLGCTPPVVPPATASPGVDTPTVPPPTASLPAPSPTSPTAASFTWAARPADFAGEDGASLLNVAAGPAGIVALSAHGPDEGSPTMRLWGSADGVTWQSINPKGLPDRVYIGGLWGAAGLYWIRGALPDSDDPGILYRSSDGVTWRPSRTMGAQLFNVSVVDGCAASTTGSRDACPIFLTGTKDVDGAILRSTDGGDTWAKSTVDDATGWKGAQDSAAVEIRGVIATSDGLLAFGNGLPKASSTSGYLQARFWRSTDGGIRWSRVPNAAPLGELLVHDVAVADQLVVAVGNGVGDQIAVVLTSSDGGRTWARSTTSGAAADGGLFQVLAGPQGFVGLGFANPSGVDNFPVRELVWSSGDGVSWHTGPAGDLAGGIVDAAVRFADMIVAVGRGWTTNATGTWEAPYGPAAWILSP
jgi:hypothetical protein